MHQELLAIAVGLSTFDHLITGKTVVLFSDNAGAERCTAGGSAKAADHNQIVHAVWLQAFTQRFHLWVKRVPTKVNIADDPSREDYRLHSALGAKWRKPTLPAPCWAPADWALQQ